VRDVVPADKVIMAVGQRVDRSWFAALEGEPARGPSATPTLICGDAATGPATIVEAIASGRRAEGSIDRLLSPETGDKGSVLHQSVLLRVDDKSPGRTSRVLTDAEQPPQRARQAADATSCRDEVLAEARRCLDCSCVAVSPSDLAPALIALGARVETTTRTLDAAQFFVASQDGSTVLEPGEILLRVRIPPPSSTARGAFMKCRERKSVDFPIVNVAVQLQMSGSRILAARLCAGAVAPVPLRLVEAERCLVGQEPSLSLCREAGAAAVRGATPLRRNRSRVRSSRLW
jgi:CO/xanthine dehydrogenase FAD-binding subunit